MTILLGDCREVLANVVPDVMITDPPYSEHVHSSATSCGTPGARPSAAAKGAAKRDLGFDFLSADVLRFTCVLAARTKRWSAIFTDTESVGKWQTSLTDAGATYIRSIPWVRWSMPQLSGDRPPQGHEMIVLAWGSQGGKKSWNGPGNLTHFSHTCMRGKSKHPTQKPLDLMLDLVEFFSDYQELVVDPFMGSGTTAMASTIINRKFLGSEKDKNWYDRAAFRLKGSEDLYDDDERYFKYEAAAKARNADMERMAANTARIVANRAKQA